MNTKSLQKEFASVYEDFFSKNDLILSGCFKLSRSPAGIGKHNNHFYVEQKMPIKCYLGFSKNNKNKIDIVAFDYFDIVKQKFVKENFANMHTQYNEMLIYIRNFLKENNFDSGYDINILSEGMRGHGIGLSGTISALISSGLFLLMGKLSIDSMKNYSTFLNSEIFKKIQSFSREIDFIARYGNSLGSNSLGTFTDTANPLVYFAEKLDIKADIESIKDKRFFYKDLMQLSDEDTGIKPQLNVDYALIFSGQESHPDKVEYYRDKDIKRIENIIESTKIDYYRKDLDLPSNDAFGKGFVDTTYNNTLMIINLKLLNAFKNIINDHHNKQETNNFIDIFNEYKNLSHLIEKQSDFAEDFVDNYKKESKINTPTLGIMPVYSGKFGGGYLVLMTKGTHREIIHKNIEIMKDKYPDCIIEYASRIDGNCADGVKIEQYISDSIFSKYISKDKLYIKSNIGENHISTYNEALLLLNKGIVLDNINSKMYLDGIKLTSKDLHSQSATISILNKLLDNVGLDISNKDLEISSYSKNKNEMTGKIIIPLIEFIQKNTGKKLPLICKGSIYEFYLKLNATDIPIFSINKL